MSWHPTLDDMERRSDGPQTRPRQVTDTQRRESLLPVIGTGGCYCGERNGHDWPGKASGLPHPRPRPRAGGDGSGEVLSGTETGVSGEFSVA